MESYKATQGVLEEKKEALTALEKEYSRVKDAVAKLRAAQVPPSFFLLFPSPLDFVLLVVVFSSLFLALSPFLFPPPPAFSSAWSCSPLSSSRCLLFFSSTTRLFFRSPACVSRSLVCEKVFFPLSPLRAGGCLRADARGGAQVDLENELQDAVK
eukprot:517880-Rhodomonas_salina.1